MPKMKTKRFRLTGSGKSKHGVVGKRHGMIKRSNETLRDQRGTHVISASENQRIKRWMPYA